MVSSIDRNPGSLRTARPFVGRDRELAEFTRILGGLEDGTGTLLMLVGQPGIGKSRTALEFAERAAQRNIPVYWGLCREESGMPPYWPWRQILKSLVDRDGGTPKVGGADNDIGPLSPVLHHSNDGGEPDVGLGANEPHLNSRFGLFDAVSGFLQQYAEEAPLVLVLDNLHLADTPSLRLLEFLSPELHLRPIVVLGTYRDIELSRNHPMTGSLGRLVNQPSFHRIRLKGFDKAEAETLIDHVAERPVSADLASAIYLQTEGNPLFITEVVRFLLDAGYLPEANGAAVPDRVRVPEGIRDAIGQRLNRLSVRCNELLSIASILGKTFALDELAALAENFPEGERNLHLEEATAAHIVEESPSPAGSLVFSHSLIRETLYDEIPATRRIQLHAAAARVIERMRSQEGPESLSRLAHHYFQGQLVSGPEKVIEYARRAAEQAASIMAYEDAAQLLRLAIDCLELSERSVSTQAAELRLQLGEVQHKAGDTIASMDTFWDVAEAARRMGSPDLFAKAALAFEAARWRPGLPASSSVDLLNRGLDQLPVEDSKLRAQLLGSLARALSYTDKNHQAASVAHEAVEMARRLGDRRVLCNALDHAFMALRRQPDRSTTRLGYCREQLDIAAELGSSELAAAAHSTLRGELLEVGELSKFELVMTEYEVLARRLRQPHYQYQLAFVSAMRALLAGEFGRVPALARDALRIGSRMPGADADGVFAMQMFALHRDLGILEDVEPALAALLENENSPSVWAPGLALLYAELGRIDSARAILENLSAGGFQSVARDELWLSSMTFLADVCGIVEDRNSAEALYRLLKPHRGRNVVFGPAIVCFGPVDRLLGIVAAVAGREERAAVHFHTALELAGRLNSPPYRVRTSCDFAEALIRQGTEAAFERALALLTPVLPEARRLGMRALLQRAETMLEQYRLASIQGSPESLTNRETQVLGLIAKGFSNARIADSLCISTATVATHVRNILAKTKCSNRTAAVAYARENRLFG